MRTQFGAIALAALTMAFASPACGATEVSTVTEAVEVHGASIFAGALGAIHFDGLNGTSPPELAITARGGLSIDQHYQEIPLTTFAMRVVEGPARVHHYGPYPAGTVTTAEYRSS